MWTPPPPHSPSVGARERRSGDLEWDGKVSLRTCGVKNRRFTPAAVQLTPCARPFPCSCGSGVLAARGGGRVESPPGLGQTDL